MPSNGVLEIGSRGSLREMVLQRVRSDIVSGRSSPGTMYSVPTLADEMGVSTTPVREALLALSRGGLITPRRNRGFLVEEVSLADLNNLFAMRELLERYAVAAIARKRLTDAGEIRKFADAAAQAVKRNDVLAYIETDRAFHRAFVARADNPLLTKMVMELRDGMRLYGIDSSAGRQRQEASVKEHYQLLGLAEAGKVKAISSLIEQHIMEWKPVFTAALLDRLGRSPKQARTSGPGVFVG